MLAVWSGLCSKPRGGRWCAAGLARPATGNAQVASGVVPVSRYLGGVRPAAALAAHPETRDAGDGCGDV